MDVVTLQLRVRDRYDGWLEALQAAWAELVPLDERGNTGEPHLSTLYHWFKGKVPGSTEALFQLAALLELDPVALFQITPESLPGVVDQLVQYYLQRRSRRALGFLARSSM